MATEIKHKYLNDFLPSWPLNPIYGEPDTTMAQQFDFISSQLSALANDIRSVKSTIDDRERVSADQRTDIISRLSVIEISVATFVKEKTESDRMDLAVKKTTEDQIQALRERVKTLEDQVGWYRWFFGGLIIAAWYAFTQLIEWAKASISWFK